MPVSFSSIQGILNGVIGDTLSSSENELAIEMNFYEKGEALDLQAPLADQLHQPLTNKLVIFIHGLTNTESIWNFKSDANNEIDNYGSRLQQSYQYTPFFLRYNSGLDIHENGKAFSETMTRLLKQYPLDVEEIVLVGFSMGGLIARCAQIDASASWTQKIKHCIYIGTPHEGAPLEKIGNLVGQVFGLFPQPYLNIWEDWINLRSTGIKSLHSGLSKQEVQFQDRAKHYFISGGLFHSDKAFRDSLIGDSLVQRKSAHPSGTPSESSFAHFDGINHISLAHSDKIYEQIGAWFETFSDDTPVKIYQASAARNNNGVSQALSHQDILLGSSKLALDLYNKSLDTVDLMHHGISEESYKVLSKVPVISKVSNAVKATHFKTSKAVFSGLRQPEKLFRIKND